MTATEYVVLVDDQDREIGLAEKLEAHQKNLMHRAFSVFIFRQLAGKEPELLLQQRALSKYHSPGLWTNTCCSHPRDGENIIKAGRRRLQEEMGFSTDLKDIGWFHYIAHFQNGLSENEVDHVLIGSISANQTFHPASDEVAQIRWVSVAELENEIEVNPSTFTPWLKQALGIAKQQSASLFSRT